MNIAINIALVAVVSLLFMGSFHFMPMIFSTAILSIALYFLSKKESIKTVAINLLIIFISLFLIESFLVSSEALSKYKKRNNKTTYTIVDRDTKKEINESKTYLKTLHEKLGYGPIPNSIISAKKIADGDVIYDAHYTIDKYGHRITSDEATCNCDKKAVLFFGCSFTYGEGIEDNQTLPFIFNLESQKKYSVFNFGFSGYGAHQMLATLENNIEYSTIAKRKVDHVYYQAILDHINRAVFATYPTKYILDEKNQLQLEKPIQETKIINVEEKQNSDSRIKKIILAKLNPNKQRAWNDITDHDRDLFLQIVKKSRDIVQKKYHTKFTVILWDLIKNNDKLVPEDEYNLNYVIKGFKDAKIDYVLISDILDGYKENSQQYNIKGDGHPSPLANKKIAQYLVKQKQ